MDFKEMARERYSVRKYSARPLEREKLDEILAAAMLAPTAKNQQPLRIYVLQSAEALEKLNALTHCAYGAGTVLLFAYDKNEEWQNPLEPGVTSGVEDVSIAATYVMLRAIELGVYTTWCNYYPNTQFERALGLPENERSVLVMPIGYRAEDALPSPSHEASRPIGEVVRYI